MKDNPLDLLIARVVVSLREYDRSHDHTKHSARETDCIRCKLFAALPPYAREELKEVP